MFTARFARDAEFAEYLPVSHRAHGEHGDLIWIADPGGMVPTRREFHRAGRAIHINCRPASREIVVLHNKP
jgi:hypothetical protein